MEFISQELDDYVCDHTDIESDLLKELNRETNVKVLNPRMLSGHYQGRVLSMLSKMIQPNRILELGTYTGYSALCLAEGLSDKGLLITVDVNPELEEMVDKYIQKSPYKNQIQQIIGNGMDVIPSLNEEFDIVFIDADKRNYAAYYDLVFDKVRKGGYIISDNVLWSGKVVNEYEKSDLDTKILKDFNAQLHNDPRVENVLLPIRDGLMIVRKIQ
ncbi:MAG: class I SAM-dependent methyltransferase [Fluviicola sp.]|jgi:predicted O-methyltransferase YrrM|nr:class I SAM-dependent methyltransferase [Fluviicola sp.]